MSDAFEEVKAFLAGWKPFAGLESQLLAGQVLAFLEAASPERRRNVLARANGLFRLHEIYRELGIFRKGRNERAEQFNRLLEEPTEEIAAAIREGRQKEPLGMLQYCFEFGRHEAPPRHEVMRQFLLTVLGLEVGSVPIKYSLFSGGVLYSGGGKTHDEMARDFARYGLGGAPMAGGQLTRVQPLQFHYDVSSTAYRSGEPGQVREALLRAVRATGGDEGRITVKLEQRV